ncbi:MAG TPA: DUF4870 domain-containing protein [Planctomycetes bacterium]|nr:DUF4870 domain-containing protein [Planctomycetota bacterium]
MDENVENQAQNEQTPPEPTPPQADENPSEGPSQNAKNMALLCHLLGFFTCFIGPLIVWLIKKDDDPYIDQQGKEALNFQITVTLASIVGGLLSVICIGLLLLAVVGLADLIFVIMACVATSKGEAYRYPVAIRLIK